MPNGIGGIRGRRFKLGKRCSGDLEGQGFARAQLALHCGSEIPCALVLSESIVASIVRILPMSQNRITTIAISVS